MSLDRFSAVPRFQRLPITVFDITKVDLTSEEVVETPTVTKIFIGYEKGKGCPVPVTLEVERIEDEYEEAYPTPEERETLTAAQYVQKARRANTLLRRNLLLAVIRDLDVNDADILATVDEDNNGEGITILRRLGWMPTPEEIETRADEETTENTEEGEALTGDVNGD